ncbi:MAG TPA: hypothetical protein P5123_05640 [Spirochaetota bacterium]|nr:hypothetical protein [Spirochaetota bacterium]
MNILLIILLLAIFLIPIWILFGKPSSSKTISESSKDSSLLDKIDFKDSMSDEFPDDLPVPTPRSTSPDEITKIGSDFKLPFNSSNIISQDSPFSIYSGTLDNADYHTQHGDFASAIDLYEGLIQRISAPDIRKKINENIDYLNNYQQISATREKERRFKEADSDSNEIKLSLGGKDYSPQNVKIDISPTSLSTDFNMDSIVNSINDQITKLNPALQQSSEKIDEIMQYKDELQQLKYELRSLYDLKEESHRIREDKIRNEIEELKSVRESLIKPQTIADSSKQDNEIEKLKSEIEELKQKQATQSLQKVSSQSIEEIHKIDVTGLPELPEHSIKITDTPEPKEQKVKITEMPDKGEIEALKLKVESISNDLTVRNLDSSANSLHQKELEELRNKVSFLENEKLSEISKEKQEENNLLRSQLEIMQKQMEELKNGSDQAKALHELKERIQNFENQNLSKSLDHEQMQRIVSEIESLSQSAKLSKDIEEKIEKLIQNQLSSGLEGITHSKIDELTSQISDLKGQLASVSSPNQTMPPSSQAQPATSTSLPQDSSIDISKKSDKADQSKQNGPVTTQDTNLQISAEEKEENKKDDFQTLEEYINGPTYEEPSEDEILDKILAESAKNKEKDYEIRGTDDSKDISDDFDLSKLFAKPSAIDTKDEEFYNQFTERNKPRVKKELPILHVSYRFDKLPEISSLSKESNVIATTFYKYKDLLEKANEYIKRRRVKDALNYYQVVMDQDIPDEFKVMLKQNIDDLKEYLEKYMLNM